MCSILGVRPQVVFTEACYGANIINKGADEAIALKFMQVGTYAIAGSTCISYGSISPPLIAADYLGHAFWSYIRDGLPAGEALRRAKYPWRCEMHTRQGYLDGEDQKTLISFILYGDPLAIPIGMEASAKAVVRSARTPTHLKTVCDRVHQDQSTEPVPPEIVAYVKGVVEQYLPGMQDASLTMSLEHVDCESTRSNRQSSPPIAHSSTGQNIQLPRQPFHLARKVVTLSKDVPQVCSRPPPLCTLDAGCSRQAGEAGSVPVNCGMISPDESPEHILSITLAVCILPAGGFDPDYISVGEIQPDSSQPAYRLDHRRRVSGRFGSPASCPTFAGSIFDPD